MELTHHAKCAQASHRQSLRAKQQHSLPIAVGSACCLI